MSTPPDRRIYHGNNPGRPVQPPGKEGDDTQSVLDQVQYGGDKGSEG